MGVAGDGRVNPTKSWSALVDPERVDPELPTEPGAVTGLRAVGHRRLADARAASGPPSRPTGRSDSGIW